MSNHLYYWDGLVHLLLFEYVHSSQDNLEFIAVSTGRRTNNKDYYWKKSKLEMPNKKKKTPTCSGQQWGPSRMWGGSHHTCGRSQRMYFWVWTARKLARGGRQGKPCYPQKSYHCERSWVSHTGRTGQRLAPVWLLEEEQWLEVKKIRKQWAYSSFRYSV